MDADVIIIGAGLAGMMGARAACEQDAKVLLLTRKAVGLATNSAISNGAFAGPTSSYGPDEYIRDTLLIGKMLNSVPHLEVAARGIGPAMDFLRSVGCHITATHGHYTVKPSRPDVIPGLTLVKTIAEGLKGSNGLTVQTGFHVTEILKHEDQTCGVEGIDMAGRKMKLYAPAVVLATGGAGAIYLHNDNQKSALGQGYAMALRAGLELRDMEFVQFYPFVLAEPGLPSLLLYPPIPKNARLINAAGEDLAEKYGMMDLNDMILKKRDDLSALLYEATLTGPVYMDYRGVPSASWAHPPLAMLGKLKFDFQNRPFAVAPAAHFFMGGVRTNPETQTELPGLFACGEVAWGLHGANRRGGNALAECMVFGRIAGTHAAHWGLTHPLTAPIKTAHASKHWASNGSSSRALLRPLGRKVREIAWNHAGVVRSEEGLQGGLALLRKIEATIIKVEPGTVTERVQREDQLSTCLVLRAIFTASLTRQESLGSFKRKDFPDEQDHSSYGNSCIRYDAEHDRFSVTFAANATCL